jgi:hypothetical protein
LCGIPGGGLADGANMGVLVPFRNRARRAREIFIGVGVFDINLKQTELGGVHVRLIALRANYGDDCAKSRFCAAAGVA